MARKRAPRFHGVLAVDKPAGPTSHDVVGWLRWVLNERTIGHCGTLDPAATGLLVVCVGPATKLAGVLTRDDKTYQARFCLGRSTTTADGEGDTVETEALSAQVIEGAVDTLRGMLGPLELAPPAYSAIRVDGVRAHELAREGNEVELPKREMIIRALRELSLVDGAPQAEQWVDATLQVSKGSYIRSIAEELGRRLGVPAHLHSLRRIACGQVSLAHPLCLVPGVEWREDRWRLGSGLGASGREAMREIVMANLLDPLAFLPTERVEVLEDGARLEALRRLAMGQKLGLSGPEGQALLSALSAGADVDPGELHFYLVGSPDEQGGQTAIEVMGRGAQGPHGPALMPLRVLRFPRPGPASGPAQLP